MASLDGAHHEIATGHHAAAAPLVDDGEADLAAEARGNLPHHPGARKLLLRGAMGHVEAEHVGARQDHALQHLRLVRRRTQRRDDLGAPGVAAGVIDVDVHAGNYKCY